MAKARFHHGNLRQSLLDASFAILDELGADAITIREIARRCGVSHAAPVNQFADRRTLMTEIAIILFGELDNFIARSVLGLEGQPKEQVRISGEMLVEYGLKHPNRYRLLWRRDLVDADEPRLQKAMDNIYNALLTRIAAVNPRTRYDDDSIAIGIWSMAHGYTSLRLDGNFEARKDNVSGKDRQKSMFDAMLEMLEK